MAILHVSADVLIQAPVHHRAATKYSQRSHLAEFVLLVRLHAAKLLEEADLSRDRSFAAFCRLQVTGGQLERQRQRGCAQAVLGDRLLHLTVVRGGDTRKKFKRT